MSTPERRPDGEQSPLQQEALTRILSARATRAQLFDSLRRPGLTQQLGQAIQAERDEQETEKLKAALRQMQVENQLIEDQLVQPDQTGILYRRMSKRDALIGATTFGVAGLLILCGWRGWTRRTTAATTDEPGVSQEGTGDTLAPIGDSQGIAAPGIEITAGSSGPILPEAALRGLRRSFPGQTDEQINATVGERLAQMKENTPPGHLSILGEPTIDEEVLYVMLNEFPSPQNEILLAKAQSENPERYAAVVALAERLGGRPESLNRIFIEDPFIAEKIIRMGKEYGIDPAFVIGFFIHESAAGSAQGWAGLKPDGSSTHNMGNIITAGYPTSYGRFRDYKDWETGIEDWYRLLLVEYVIGRGAHTVESIIPIYAPSFENNVPRYIQAVRDHYDASQRIMKNRR